MKSLTRFRMCTSFYLFIIIRKAGPRGRGAGPMGPIAMPCKKKKMGWGRKRMKRKESREEDSPFRRVTTLLSTA